MTNKELEQKLNQLTETVETLKSIVNLAKNLPQASNPQLETKIEVKPEDKINRILGGISEPVLPEYRQAVDELLNKDFGIHINHSTLGTKFTILVPKKYSTELEYDVRPKVIPYADGLNGVKSWCEKVLGTFNEQTKALIIAQRISSQITI